jgi:hypothetical protein
MYTGILSENELISDNTSLEFHNETARGLKT